ncbi:zinc-finger domain-containing protein [Kingella oralis]|jgi:hypothetical protein|uniref:zinc-finger domain-containing protein n=1 Tax=Kingella oralis TaxID=505 RepID=UPI002D7F0311|nr:zinc-finger domain-containing protein [Kingella oralis]
MTHATTPPVQITPQDLPLHCDGSAVTHHAWNGHPRVFLPIQSNGEIECPYCGTIYQLNGELPHHHAPTLSGGH